MAWSYKDFTYNPWSYKDFTYDAYKEGDSVLEALKKKQDAENALANYGDFAFSKQGEYDTLYDQYKNRKDFVYDINGDALYQQYKDKYIKQAKLAMGDVIGQASAMTGGYGNSYAQSVGQQAYQGQLDNLNDIVPELYQMALDRYNMQGQEMRDMISLLGNERNFEYGVWGDGYNRLASDRDYYGSQYDSERSWDYGKYTNERDFAYNQYSSDRALDYEKYSSDRNLAYDKYSTDKNLSYEEYRAAIADAQWQQQYDDSKYVNAGGQYKISADEKGNPVVTPDLEATAKATAAQSVPTKIVDAVKNYSTQQGQADYLAKQVEAGKITEAQAMQLLDQYGVVSLTERNWEMTDDGGWNLFGIDRNASVRDQFGNEYTLADLKKELKKTMTNSEATKYIKNLQKQLGID